VRLPAAGGGRGAAGGGRRGGDRRVVRAGTRSSSSRFARLERLPGCLAVRCLCAHGLR
jgi:hypothetical protein